jgi:integrase
MSNEKEKEELSLQEQFDSLTKLSEIERRMLSRAIYVLCELTGKRPPEVVQLLSLDLDDEYSKAVDTATEDKKPKLYVPSRKLI